VVETLHHKIIKSKSLLILLLFHKTLQKSEQKMQGGKKERKERRQWQDTKAKSAKAGLGLPIL